MSASEARHVVELRDQGDVPFHGDVVGLVNVPVVTRDLEVSKVRGVDE